jgi:GNAT superfamily N-acetyltransferase
MGVRIAKISDCAAIRELLDQLDYPGTGDFLEQRLATMLGHPDERLLVYEDDPAPPSSPQILAVLSLHFIPQLGVAGDFARISYFAVSQDARSRGIGRVMEEFATGLARQRGCKLLEVHCHERRKRAHGFYFRQGYQESPKYLIKKL